MAYPFTRAISYLTRILAYVVQGHRFDIFQELGCFPSVYNTLMTYFLVSVWPVVIGLVSAVYCGGFLPIFPPRRRFTPPPVLTLRSFLARRAQFTQFLSSNKSLTAGRYVRLMALASTEMLLTTPLALSQMIINLKAQPLEPWRSWADTHSNFSRVVLVSSVLWRHSGISAIALEVTRWSAPLCAFMFFFFFGFAEESRRSYRRVIDSILSTCRIRREAGSTQSRPWYVFPALNTNSLSHLNPRVRQLSLPTVASSQSLPPAYTPPPPRYSSGSPSTSVDAKSPTTSYSEFEKEKQPDSCLTRSSIC